MQHLLLAFATLSVRGQVFTPDLISSIQETITASNITGLSVGVIRNGVNEIETWGLKSEDGSVVNPETIYPIGSTSKAFVSAAMGILMDDFAQAKNATALPAGISAFTWTTKIQQLLPNEWALEDEWATQKASVRDILSHVSGLPGHDFAYAPSDTVPALLSRTKYLKPDFELREQYSYSNIMYTVASRVITVYSGRTYEEFVEDRIFKPLNMSSSTFSVTAANATGELTQLFNVGGRRIPQFVAGEILAGAGGIFSSAVDMGKWTAMLLNKGVDPSSNVTVIPAAALETVTTAQVIIEGGPSSLLLGYAMGWIRNSLDIHEMVWHNGAVNGASSLVAFFPDANVGVVLLANGDGKAAEAQVILASVVQQLGLITSSGTSGNVTSDATPAAAAPSLAKRVHTTRALPALNRLGGTYHNPGYGNITLCSSPTESTSCARVITDFNTVEPSASNSTSLFAAWERVWNTHLEFVFAEGNYFIMTATSLYPRGYGADSSPFRMDVGSVYAEFDVVGDEVVGFGLLGLSGRAYRLGANTVEGRSDVWFEKSG